MKINTYKTTTGRIKNLLTSPLLYVYPLVLGGCNSIESNMHMEDGSRPGNLTAVTDAVAEKGITVNEKEKILELKQLYDKILSLNAIEIESSASVSLSNGSTISLDRTHEANVETMSAHGTNGFVLLLSVLTGKQLLPHSERMKRGIPTLTGEAQYSKYKEIYHNNWQHFVSTVPLEMLDHNFETLYRYACSASKEFADKDPDFKQKLYEIGRNIAKTETEALQKLFDSEPLKQLYTTLSAIPIVVLGDGIGFAANVHSMGCEDKYKRVNLRAILVPDAHESLFKDLFSILEIEHDIALMLLSNFRKFLTQRAQTKKANFMVQYPFQDKYDAWKINDIPRDSGLDNYVKSYGYNDTAAFIEKFGNNTLESFFTTTSNPNDFSKSFLENFKLPCHFATTTYTVSTHNEAFVFENKDKTNTIKTESIIYHLPN